jgi:2-methylcitrate dehydratase PrpD
VHPHGTFGPLAAAVAVGRLRGIGAAAMARLINLAAPLGIAASRRALAEGATVRNVYTGASGTMAWLALDLLESGFTAEGDAVGSVFGGLYGEAFDPAATAGLGTRWRLLEGFFKLFPYGRYVHSALDLVDGIAARRGGDLSAATVEHALIETYFMAATMGQQAVTSPFGLRFSIPAAVAARLLGLDREPLADFDALFARPELHAPARQRSRLTLRLADGTVETAEAEHIRGEPENPHPTSALEAKFRALTAPAWGAESAEAALAALMRIEALPRLRPVTASWRAAASRTQPEEEHDPP